MGIAQRPDFEVDNVFQVFKQSAKFVLSKSSPCNRSSVNVNHIT